MHINDGILVVTKKGGGGLSENQINQLIDNKVSIKYDYYYDDFTGDEITLPFLPISTLIVVAGLPQREGEDRDYTVKGSKIVFNYQLQNDDIHIQFTYLPL